MAPFEQFVFPARKKLGHWRLLIGIIIIVFGWGAGVMVSLGAEGLYCGLVECNSTSPLELTWTLASGGSPEGILILLLSFITIPLAVWLAGSSLHSVNLGHQYSFRNSFSLEIFWQGLRLALVVVLVSIVASLFMAIEVKALLGLEEWLVFVLPTLFLISIQVTAEEVVFRRYLLQQLAARYKSWIVWAAIPSLLFGLLHYDPELPGNTAVYYVLVTFLFGLSACVLVWRTGTLWSAIGFHFGINAFALLISGIDGVAIGTQLYVVDIAHMGGLIRMDLIISTLILAVLLSPFGRMFNAKR